MQCPNCQYPISCSCSLRSAYDGKQCCSLCINDYNSRLEQLRREQQNQTPQQLLQHLGDIKPPHLR